MIWAFVCPTNPLRSNPALPRNPRPPRTRSGGRQRSSLRLKMRAKLSKPHSPQPQAQTSEPALTGSKASGAGPGCRVSAVPCSLCTSSSMVQQGQRPRQSSRRPFSAGGRQCAQHQGAAPKAREREGAQVSSGACMERLENPLRELAPSRPNRRSCPRPRFVYSAIPATLFLERWQKVSKPNWRRPTILARRACRICRPLKRKQRPTRIRQF